MSVGTVEVAYVNQPKNNPKYGSIKSTKGTYFSVPVDMLGFFQPQKIYEIDYETNDKGYHTVKRVKSAPAAALAESSATPQRFQKQPTNPIDAQRIFICGAINAALHGQGLGAVVATELGAAIDALELVWRSKKSLGREATAIEKDLDDEVPFSL